MPFSDMRRYFLWGLVGLSPASGLPGPALLIRENSKALSNELSNALNSPSQQFDALDTLQARALQITPNGASIPNYTYAGCYIDANPSSLEPQYLLGGTSYTSATAMTWASCTSFCAGFQYAGIDGGAVCRCGNSFTYSPLLALDRVCSSPCTGNAVQSCGGGNRLTIFRNSNSANIVSPSDVIPASSSLVAQSSLRTPTTLVAIVAASSIHSSTSALSTASSLALATGFTFPTPATVANPLAALLFPSPAPVLAPLLSPLVPASSSIPGPVITSLPQAAGLSLTAASLPTPLLPPLVSAASSIRAPLIASLAQAAGLSQPTTSLPTLPLPSIQALLSTPQVIAPAITSGVNFVQSLSVSLSPFIPAAVAVSSANSAFTSPQAAIVPSFVLPALQTGILSLPALPVSSIASSIVPFSLPSAPTMLSQVPVAIQSLALPVVPQVLPASISPEPPAITSQAPSLEGPGTVIPPSVALLNVSTPPLVAVPQLAASSVIPNSASSLISGPTAGPPIALPIADLFSPVLGIPVSLSTPPSLSALPAAVFPIPSILSIPTELPSSALPILSLLSPPVPGEPAISPVSLPDSVAALTSLGGSLPAISTIGIPAAGGFPTSNGSPIPTPSLPILEGLQTTPSSLATQDFLPLSILDPIVTNNLSPAPTSRPSVIDQGTVYDNTHTWTFFRTGAVRVDDSYLVPTTGQFVGFLPDGTLVGLFVDGLHINEHFIPYPPAYLALLTKYHLDVAPLELLDYLLQD